MSISAPDQPLDAERKPVPGVVRLGSALAWSGVWISILLLRKDVFLPSFLCPARGGCEAVLESSYSEIQGIPLSWIGLGFYLVQLILWLAITGSASAQNRRRLVDAALWLAVAAMTFSAGLMYVQFWKLRAFCPLCTASAVVVAAILIAGFRARPAVSLEGAGASPGGAISLAVFAFVPLMALLGPALNGSSTARGIWLADLSKGHQLGAVDARIQLVVYSDFQCGFCRELAPVLRRLEDEYPHDLAIVFRSFPLDVHPRALAAAEAAECAGEQGKFWEYHDKLFAEGGELDEATLSSLAVAVGLDEERFKVCLNSARPREAVEASVREAEALHLQGAPTLFLNGRLVEGALTYGRLRSSIRTILDSSVAEKK